MWEKKILGKLDQCCAVIVKPLVVNCSVFKAVDGTYVVRDLITIHRMQILPTAPSAPGTSRMKARLVSLRCFV